VVDQLGDIGGYQLVAPLIVSHRPPPAARKLPEKAPQFHKRIVRQEYPQCRFLQKIAEF
jgi:hypothetical protein